ncbi:DUF5011 domain-containing protein [Acholeplasma sp. OttesenSCG-928-E16]|nr:DUF5011 domain-containing protein [Acholeplasma sp. OttesenSCG-928-E16]
MSNNLLKKITLVMLVVISVITLSACSVEGDRYGNITSDKYLSVGDYTVTNKDLYDAFRLDAQSVLKEWFDETLVEEELTKVDGIIATYTADFSSIAVDSDDYPVVEWLETLAVNAIFGSTAYANLETLNHNTKLISANSYVDSLTILDRDLDTTGLVGILIDKLDAWLAAGEPKEDDDWRAFNLPKVVLDQYRLTAAQKLRARSLFNDEEFDDEENTYYISENDLVNYYNNNKKGKFDVEAFIVTFANTNEANAALRDPSINIKSTSRGEWVVIPDPRYMSDAELNTDDYAHVRQVLNDLNITLQPYNAGQKRMSEADYKSYYDKYSISTSRTDGKKDVVLTEEQVLQKFIEIRELVENVALTDDQKKVKYEYTDEIFTINSSLRSHIYSTLVIPDGEDSNDKQYSPRVQSLGNYVYLAYKYADLKPEFEDDLIVTIENEDEEEETIFNVDGLNPDTLETDDKTEARKKAAEDARAEVYDEVKESKFTDAYVNTTVSELYEDKKPVIYDSKIKVFFNFDYSSSITLGSGRNTDKNVVAEFEGKTFYVSDLYTEMEKMRGVSTALDVAFTKLIRDEYNDEITKSDIKDFQEQYKTLINNFSSDQLSSSGYPASMGRKNFLLVAFGATSNETAIDNMYVIPKLKELYYADLEAHYGEGIYEKFATLAGLQYDNYKSITGSHLLVYIDRDLDGSPDDPNDLNIISEADRLALEKDIIRLIKIIYNRLGDYTTLDIGFNAIITEYDAVNRVAAPITPNDLNEGTSSYDAIWREFKQKGIYLKYESLSAITNTTNTPASQSYDQAFVDRLMHLHGSMKEFINQDGQVPGDKGVFPFLDSYSAIEGDSTGVDQNLINNVRSTFGWHFISITSLSYPTSAKAFRVNDDDEDPVYISDYEDAFGNQLKAYNNNDQLSADQIQIYIEESASEYGVQSLPSTVSTAISSYFTPIKTKYDGTTMQRELLIRYVLDQHNGSFANTAQSDFADQIRAINRRQIEEYNTLPGLEAVDSWNALWASWWDVLESNTIVAPNLVHIIGEEAPDYLKDVKVVDQFNKEVEVSVSVDSSDVKLASDTDKGIYNVVYTATVDGKTITKTVTVRVVESEIDEDEVDEAAPSLDINDATDIIVTVGSSLDDLVTLIRGRVSATDAADGNLTSQISINTKWVDLNTKTTSGGYIVILTVTDSSGNEVVKTLVVRVQ